MTVYNITFSPTGGTQKAADLFAKSFAPEYVNINLLDCKQDFSAYTFNQEDTCLVAVPSYGGRVPAIAVSRLSQMQGNGANAILIVVYGNRAYDDTFVELQDTLSDCGFNCIAAVAALAEHSIMRQFAAGRPDENDEKELADFAQKILAKIQSDAPTTPLFLPGNRPYRKYGGVPMKPITGKACNQCGVCARECPVGAINAENPSQTNTETCISCMRCLAVCPQNARHISKMLLTADSLKLKSACSGYKNNELFLP